VSRAHPSIAVVGGGIFGVTAAVDLARAGYSVELFEGKEDLLQAASGINQYRLHRGYHYPRSDETARTCRDSEQLFEARYPDAITAAAASYYAIAARGSRTSAEQYLQFCTRLGLEHEIEMSDVVRPDAVDLSVRVRERLFDPVVLRRLAWSDLQSSGVVVRLGTPVSSASLDRYDLVVIATYAAINDLLDDAPSAQRTYQFEVCEKPVVRLPEHYQRQSVVVMDGPFMCFDPLSGTDLYVLGNVVHAIHETSVGTHPSVSPALARLLDRGVVVDPGVTAIDQFIAAGSEFFEQFDRATHVGSMYTIRVVLPDVDRTDERPTLVARVDDHRLTLFSGKIDTCVAAAREVVAMAREQFGVNTDKAL
jgi:hypothetical protein